MWQVYAVVAADLIRDRQREAARDRLGRMAHAAGDDPVARRPADRWLRIHGAQGLRRLAAAAVSLARIAGNAAARLEGRAA